MGLAEFYGAEFDHSGNKIFAIPMIQEGKESFYDIEGNSLRKAFLQSAIEILKDNLRLFLCKDASDSWIVSLIMLLIMRRQSERLFIQWWWKIISATIEAEPGRIVRIKHNSVYSTGLYALKQFCPVYMQEPL